MAKRLAVADEDYDKAKEIKDEVDSLRAEIEQKVRIRFFSCPQLLIFLIQILLVDLSLEDGTIYESVFYVYSLNKSILF